MTQEEVANAVGTAQAVVARLEYGKSMPSTRTLEQFLELNSVKSCGSVKPEEGKRRLL